MGSSRKARLVTNAIKGKRVEKASALLQFMPQAAARDVASVLKSATANAENNHNLSAEDLVVADAQANMGPGVHKRWRPRAPALVDAGSHVCLSICHDQVLGRQVVVVLSVSSGTLEN